jgi:adenosylcobyric acid synthase
VPGLLVAGTTSDAGKSVVTAGICRWLARRGVKVAPFKAQNMSLNSMVTVDGAEIGRAQAMQAAAAGAEPEAAMNPVLLKPGAGGRSQVMVLGTPVAEADAVAYRALKPRLLTAVLDSLADLRARFDVVVCEGAGSPAEINLRDGDIANMGLARAAGLPVIVVADIDRGGAFAASFGTLALLCREDQALVAGFVLNKFRGDRGLLEPGLAMLHRVTGRPTLGVLPWRHGLWLDVEDSLGLAAGPGAQDGAGLLCSGGGTTPAARRNPPTCCRGGTTPASRRNPSQCCRGGTTPASRRNPPPSPAGQDGLRVAVVRLPHISNFTDADPLAAEPGVTVTFTADLAEVAGADLVMLPGSRATVADLAWLRQRGLAGAIAARARAGLPVLGICAGFQMLAREIHDDVESGAGRVQGLGLLPAAARFGPGKVLRRRSGTAFGETVTGYEIYHGRVDVAGGDPFPGGCAAGEVRGTSWHGLLESDGFRRALLRQVAAAAGRDFTPGHVCFSGVRQHRLDVLGDLVANHMDTGALLNLIDHGPPPGLPFILPGAP